MEINNREAVYFTSLTTVPGKEHRQEGCINPSGNPFGLTELPINTIIPEFHIFPDVASKTIRFFWDNPSRGGEVVVCCDYLQLQEYLYPGDSLQLPFDARILLAMEKREPVYGIAIQLLQLMPDYLKSIIDDQLVK